MNNKRKYLMVDTETANSIEDNLMYDFGGAVIDNTGKVYEEFSYVIKEIYYNEELMDTAYYKDKKEQYEKEIAEHKREVISIMDLRETLFNLIKDYGIKAAIAHNASFDARAMNNTIRYITKSKCRYLLPYGLEWQCTLKMARKVLTTDRHYIDFCEDFGFLTKSNEPQTKAETIYRYLTGNPTFEEAHTGLCDVMIEKEIFAFLVGRCKIEDRVLYFGKKKLKKMLDTPQKAWYNVITERGEDNVKVEKNFKKVLDNLNKRWYN